MKSESTLLYEVWEIVREFVPAARRGDTSVNLLRQFHEYGMTKDDLIDVLDEDDSLLPAFKIVFEYDDEDEEENEDDELQFD